MQQSSELLALCASNRNGQTLKEGWRQTDRQRSEETRGGRRRERREGREAQRSAEIETRTQRGGQEREYQEPLLEPTPQTD